MSVDACAGKSLPVLQTQPHTNDTANRKLKSTPTSSSPRTTLTHSSKTGDCNTDQIMQAHNSHTKSLKNKLERQV